MKSIGIVRKVDDLGRIVIPKETRDLLGIEEGTPLEIYMDGELIILKKYQPGCVICGSMDGITIYKNRPVCSDCFKNLN